MLSFGTFGSVEFCYVLAVEAWYIRLQFVRFRYVLLSFVKAV